MRAYFYLFLFVVVLALPFAMHRALMRGHPEQAAGAERLVIITPHNQDIRREFNHAFSAWHQKRYGAPVELVFLSPGGTNDIRRQLENIYSGWRDKASGRLPEEVPIDIDLVWGGGNYFYEVELGPLGILQPMPLEGALLGAVFPEPALAGVPLYDRSRDSQGRPTPRWVGTCLSAFGIIYNPDLYQTLELAPPRTWGDLTDPKLAGLLALADPTHSGSAAVAYMMVIQRAMADEEERFLRVHPELEARTPAERAKEEGYRQALAAGWKRGMGQLVLIAANARYFSEQAQQPPNDVGNGQAAAGVAIDFYGRAFEESVGAGRCRVVLPPAATAITPDPVAVLHGVKGRRLELALHFVEFLLSREGQLLWILRPGEPLGPALRSLRRPPIRRALYADRSGWADDVDPFATAGRFNQRAEWMGLYSETRALWSAAWIDSRDALKEAYQRVLRIEDPARRQRLLSELTDLPVTMADVERMRSERKKMEQAAQAEEWKAFERVRWAVRFRDHYTQVGKKAGGR